MLLQSEKKGYLPAWWTEESREECGRLAERLRYKSTTSLLPVDWRHSRVRANEAGSATREEREDLEPEAAFLVAMMKKSLAASKANPQLDSVRRQRERLTSLDHEEVYMDMARMFEAWLDSAMSNNRPRPRIMPKALLFKTIIEGMEDQGRTPQWWTTQTQRECEELAASMDYKFVPYRQVEISLYY